MERIRKGSDLPKKKWGHQASNKNIRRSSYRKGHQRYILLSFDSVRALEIHDVARATSCIACALEMRSSNGRERPEYDVAVTKFRYYQEEIDLRWLKTVSSTFQDVDFDGS